MTRITTYLPPPSNCIPPFNLNLPFISENIGGLGLQVFFRKTNSWSVSTPPDTVIHVKDRLAEMQIINLIFGTSIGYIFNSYTNKWRPFVEAGSGAVSFYRWKVSWPYSQEPYYIKGQITQFWQFSFTPYLEAGIIYRIKNQWGIELGANIRKFYTFRDPKVGIACSFDCYLGLE